MIGVYRIYVGHAWSESGRGGQLMALLDTLPEFLCQPMALADDEIAAARTPEEQHAAVRIAMTQAHVLVVPAEAGGSWTQHEIDIARRGLRHTIPVLAVRTESGAGEIGPAAGLADRVVGWSAEDVAIAIQEVTEAAAAARRETLRRRLGETAVADALPPGSVAPQVAARLCEEPTAPRALPTEQIIEAFTQLTRARLGNGSADRSGH